MNKHKDCYAQSLGGCSDKISREHYISENLLKEIHQKEIHVKGMPWMKDEEKILPPSALVLKVLCEKHNHTLADLDKYAGNLFKTIKKYFSQKDIKEEWVCEIKTIQRWLIKVYLGMHVGNLLGKEGQSFSLLYPDIEPYLLENLFYGTQLPEPFGLYFNVNLPPIIGASGKFNPHDTLSLTTHSNPGTDIIHALICHVGVIPFYLLIRPRPNSESAVRLDRIETINIYNSVIKFQW